MLVVMVSIALGVYCSCAGDKVPNECHGYVTAIDCSRAWVVVHCTVGFGLQTVVFEEVAHALTDPYLSAAQLRCGNQSI